MTVSNGALPETYKIVTATPIITTNGAAVVFDNVSLKNCQMAYIVIELLAAVGHAHIINPLLGANVTTCATVPTFNMRWWMNSAILVTDTLVEQTAGTTMTTDAAATNKLVVIQVNPDDMANQGATLDCLGCSITASTHAEDFVSATYILEQRFAQATPPSAILD